MNATALTTPHTAETIAAHLAKAAIRYSDLNKPSLMEQEMVDAARQLIAENDDLPFEFLHIDGKRAGRWVEMLSLKPVVGMGSTEIGWTDREPFHIVKVCTATKIVVRAAKAERDTTWKPEIIPGGFVGHCVNNSEQRWFITPGEPGAREVELRRHKDGRWYSKNGVRFGVGYAAKHYDYNF